MRVCCPKCKEKFDVAHAAVLAEAAKLMERARESATAGKSTAKQEYPLGTLLRYADGTRLRYAKGGKENPPAGNRLDPNDAEARLLKQEAVERRLKDAEDDRLARDMVERRSRERKAGEK